MAKSRRKKQAGDNGTSNAQGENVQGYFRQYFEANRHLLKTRSNDAPVRQWFADHPGITELPQRVKSGLANVKTALRKKYKLNKRRRRAEPSETAPTRPGRLAPLIIHRLEGLEEQIDDCLMQAKRLNVDGLEDTVKYLRRARNGVVWKLGQ